MFKICSKANYNQASATALYLYVYNAGKILHGSGECYEYNVQLFSHVRKKYKINTISRYKFITMPIANTTTENFQRSLNFNIFKHLNTLKIQTNNSNEAKFNCMLIRTVFLLSIWLKTCRDVTAIWRLNLTISKICSGVIGVFR